MAELKCETCGMSITKDRANVRVIDGVPHYFCCGACAAVYQARHIVDIIIKKEK